MTLPFQIHCHTMPGATFDCYRDVRLSIQRGKDIDQEVPGDTPEATFSFDLRVEPHKTTGAPNFLGPYAQGPAEERFVYLVWRAKQGYVLAQFRRAKVHLSSITWEQIKKAEETGKPLRISLSMTGSKGDPRCASIKTTAADWEV